MEHDFLSPRWCGRLIGLLLNIAVRRGVSFETTQNVTLGDLYNKVKAVASNKESDVLLNIMYQYSEAKRHDELSGITFSADEGKKLEAMGHADADMVYEKGLNLNILAQLVDIHEKAKNTAATKTKKRIWIAVGCIVALVIGIIAYNSPYIAEMRYYYTLLRKPNVYSCKYYYQLYPNGKYYEDIMQLEMSLSVKEHSRKDSYYESDNPLKVGERYLSKFPNGKYADEFKFKCDSLRNITEKTQ
jgi:hypothetical protein